MENKILNVVDEKIIENGTIEFTPTMNFLDKMVDLEKFVSSLVDSMEGVADNTNDLYEEYLELIAENKKLKAENKRFEQEINTLRKYIKQ